MSAEVDAYKMELASFIRQCIEERQAWASSPEGYRELGPGSPTVPGMQEYFQILAYVEGREFFNR